MILKKLRESNIEKKRQIEQTQNYLFKAHEGYKEMEKRRNLSMEHLASFRSKLSDYYFIDNVIRANLEKESTDNLREIAKDILQTTLLCFRKIVHFKESFGFVPIAEALIYTLSDATHNLPFHIDNREGLIRHIPEFFIVVLTLENYEINKGFNEIRHYDDIIISLYSIKNSYKYLLEE